MILGRTLQISSSDGWERWTTQVLKSPLVNILWLDPNFLFTMIILSISFSISHVAIHSLPFLNSSSKATQMVRVANPFCPYSSISSWGLIWQVVFSKDSCKRSLTPLALLIMWLWHSFHSSHQELETLLLPSESGWVYDIGKNDVIWLLRLSHKRWCSK